MRDAVVDVAAWTQWRDALAAGVRRMQAAGHVGPGADAVGAATAIVAAIQGGLMLSQPLRSPAPLAAALDHALAPLVALSTSTYGRTSGTSTTDQS